MVASFELVYQQWWASTRCMKDTNTKNIHRCLLKATNPVHIREKKKNCGSADYTAE